MAQISVIIPALNEEKTIAKIVETAKSSPNVHEVIVVDDKSVDKTVAEAKRVGAIVIESKMLGKGTSMADGFQAASGDILIYLDADLKNMSSQVIESLAKPILSGEADFVKSSFGRKAGRITELVAKPLLELFFPEATGFQQPLSGMIAGKREFFSKVKFEPDYGVDVGILLDMLSAGASIMEVHIGRIEHKMKSWRKLRGMSFQVSKAIIKRAQKLNKISLIDLTEIEQIEQELSNALENTMAAAKKLAIFDMDGTLLEGRTIMALANKFGFLGQAEEIMSNEHDLGVRMMKLASMLRGRSSAEFLEVIDAIPLMRGAKYLIAELKRLGYTIGIVSGSYDLAAGRLKEKLGLDFAIANNLGVMNGVLTGEVTIPSIWIESFCTEHKICKLNVIQALAKKAGITLNDCLAVGDNEPDCCMLKHAGIGVAFSPKAECVRQSANILIEQCDLQKIIEYI